MLISHELEAIKKYTSSKKLSANGSLSQTNKTILNRRIIEAIIITLFTYVGLILGPIDKLGVPIWPHIGIMLGLLFLRGQGIGWWLLLGSLIAYITSGISLVEAISFSALNALGILFLYNASIRWIGPIAPLTNITVLLKWLIAMVLLGSFLGIDYLALLEYFKPGTWTLSNLLSTVLVYPLSVIVFTPLCLVWDTFIQNKSKAIKIKKLVCLVALVLLTHFSFCLLSKPAFVFSAFALSLCLMPLATYWFKAFGCCWMGIITALFLLTFIDLPGYVVIHKYPFAVLWMQAALMTNVIIHLILATTSTEKKMLGFVKNHPVFLAGKERES